MADGGSAREAPRIDLLLVRTDPGPRVPIVCEVKIGGDQNVHYALIQALALAAQLAPVAQRKRLSERAYQHKSVAVDGGIPPKAPQRHSWVAAFLPLTEPGCANPRLTPPPE